MGEAGPRSHREELDQSQLPASYSGFLPQSLGTSRIKPKCFIPSSIFCWKTQMKMAGGGRVLPENKTKTYIFIFAELAFLSSQFEGLGLSALRGGKCLHLKAELKEKHPRAPFHCARHDEQTMVVNMIKVTLSGCKIHFSPFSTWCICLPLQLLGCSLSPRRSRNCPHSLGRVPKI